jgi:hypothetical protein
MPEPFLVGLPEDDDLLEAITRTFREREIRKAAFSLIGAVKRGALGYYDLSAKQYKTREFEGLLEIVACAGNVSERDGDVFVHAHAVFSGADYGCVGGHLIPGNVIFVGELYGTPVPGPVPVRVMNPAIGIALWPREQDGGS